MVERRITDLRNLAQLTPDQKQELDFLEEYLVWKASKEKGTQDAHNQKT